MGTHDKRIDAYIAKSAEFSRPILTRLRELVHEGCPDVVETVKWSHPSFEYKGVFAGMAAFKQHCAFGFWKHELVVGDDAKAKEAMGSFGALKQLSDLPPKAEFLRYVKKAKQLNDDGVKAVRAKTKPKAPVAMHPKLKVALAKKKGALVKFGAFNPSQQREYLEWIADAKAEETRDRRIAQAVEWIAEGKPRHWKYMKC
ncbi:MAG TPA: YdeI/OmpD-associated family protein [Planctomycetota bacterium]|nr:YdeI/OmpD-associated family protein [Planctomycetota bacterium]